MRAHKQLSEEELAAAKAEAQRMLDEEEIFDRDDFVNSSEHLKVRSRGYSASGGVCVA